MKLLLKIQYDGSRFCGYQVQPNVRSVQGELNRAAYELFRCDCNITGCSRTDSGVHALSFFATVEPKASEHPNIPLKSIARAFNSILADDISVIGAYEVDDSFHARYDVVSKEYVYLMTDTNHKNPFLDKRALHLQRPLSDDQISRVNLACSQIVGEYDFTSFMSEGSKITDATRRIYHASINRLTVPCGLILFKISANGFLYNMVRIIVGTMLDVAYGKIEPDEIKHIIEQKNRSLAGQTVPPDGLYLNKVTYSDKNIL